MSAAVAPEAPRSDRAALAFWAGLVALALLWDARLGALAALWAAGWLTNGLLAWWGGPTGRTAIPLVFFHVPNKPHITGLNWRLMLASVGSILVSIVIVPSIHTVMSVLSYRLVSLLSLS